MCFSHLTCSSPLGISLILDFSLSNECSLIFVVSCFPELPVFLFNSVSFVQTLSPELVSYRTPLGCVVLKMLSNNLVPRAFPSKNGWGREKALASAGHVSILHPEILGVINLPGFARFA